MDFGTLFIFMCMATVFFVVIGMRSSAAQLQQGSSAKAQEQKVSRDQMVEDIKLTKTSRVVDEVSILDELSQGSPNYRQYCELVGTSQREGGVIAPYSRREVAYYEIRCYRIENRGSGDVETLVAHERSFDPFYFVDDSCDTRVYVNLESFGDNVMLINSTNHIEGPNSDFAKAVGASATGTASASSGVTAIVGNLASGVVHGFDYVRDAVRSLLPGPALQSQLAYAGGYGSVPATDASQPKHLLFAGKGDLSSRVGGFAKAGGSMMPGNNPATRKAQKASSAARVGGSGRPSSSRPQQSQPQRQVTVNIGMPTGLGSFLGSGRPYGGYSSVPRPMPHYPRPIPTHTYRRTNSGDVISDMLTGMVLSTILDSMASSSSAQATTTQRPQNTFRGYRLVEDVVPLGSPVYCIGELYHHGTDVYMGRSLATDYPTSYFATKPEVEVLASLGA